MATALMLGLSLVATPSTGGGVVLKAFRIVPVDANTAYVVRRQSGGSGMAYRFGQGGAAADASNIGVAYLGWRLTGVAKLLAFDSDPASPSVVFSDDVGAQDLVANASGLFMLSYHGIGASGALNSESVLLDGAAANFTVATQGDTFELTNDVTASNGTVSCRRSLTVTLNETGPHFKINSISGTGVTFIYAGMSVGTGAFDETDVRVSAAGPRLTFANGSGAARHLLDSTYEVRIRDTATGRRIALRSAAPLVTGFSRGEVQRITSVVRSKGYLNFTNVTALVGFEWDMDVDIGPTGSQVAASNIITNGAFPTDIAGWASVIGTAVAWASPGLMRMTRDASLVQRWRWNTAAPAIVDDWIYYSVDLLAVTGLAPSPRISPANSMSGTNALVAQSTQLGANGILKKVAAANITANTLWAGFEYSAGTAGQVSDFDNFVLNNFGAA